MLINAAESCLIVVDIQERLCPVIDDPRTILYNATRLLRGAALLDVPALITEHCPQSIGPTMIDLREEFSPDQVVTKTAFSAAAEPAVRDRVAALGRRQLILCGTEAMSASCRPPLASAPSDTMFLSPPTPAIPPPGRPRGRTRPHGVSGLSGRDHRNGAV